MEDMKFQLLNKDELIADVEVKDNRVHVKRYNFNPGLQLFYADEISAYQLMDTFKDRCHDPNRANIADVLAYFKLDHYDPLTICRHTHGLMYNDFLWFRFEGEDIVYNDIKIRDEEEADKEEIETEDGTNDLDEV